MKAKPYKQKNKDRFAFKDPKNVIFSISGIVLILIGVYLAIPILIPLIQLVFGIILIVGGYILVQKNSNLFKFE